MKRIISALVLASAVAAFAAAQQIDNPVATVKLTKLEVISSRQFKADLQRLEKAGGKALQDAERRQFLDARINDILFFQYCARENIVVSDGEINGQIQAMKTQLGKGATDAQLEAALSAQGIQLSDLRTYIKQMMLLNKYIEAKKSAEAKALKEPTADEILQTYELYKSKLVRPEAARISIIYIDARSMNPADRAKAGELIQGIGRQVRADKSKFDEFLLKGAQKDSGYSVTPSLVVGKVPETMQSYGQRFMDVVFGMKAGDISEIIENQLGYQIIRINETFPQKQLTLTDPYQIGQTATVQDYIKYQIMEFKKTSFLKKSMEELFVQLKKEATIKIFEENLKF